MNKNNLIAIALFAATFGTIAAVQSCTKLAQLLNVNLDMQTESVNVTIPVTTDTTGNITVGPATNTFNVDSFIKAQTGSQFGVSNIESVKLHSVVFTLNDADLTNNFRCFKSVSAAFYSNSNNTPFTVTIPNNPDQYATSLSLPVDTTADLKSYIGNQFYYTITGSLRHATTKELHATVTFTFGLHVKA